MSAMSESSSSQDALKICVRPDIRGLIDRAAALCGTSRSDFILEAARAAAEETLLDQQQIRVSAKAYAEFLNRLEQPPKPNKQLRKTMQSSAPWENA